MKKFFLILFLQCLGGTFACTQIKAFEILSENNNEILIKFVPQKYEMEIVEIDGEQYFIPKGKNSGSTNESGKPGLPIEATLIAIPPNKKVTIEILESKFVLLENQKIAPVPEEVIIDEENVKSEFRIDKNFYNLETEFYPNNFYSIEGPIKLRYNYVVKINIFPMQYLAISQTLKLLSHLVFKVKYIDNVNLNNYQIGVVRDEQFESIYKSLILNYETSRKIRVKDLLDQEKKINDSTRIWWQTGRNYYKIPVSKDGIYRLTYSILQGAGIDLQSIQVSTIAMYYMGNSVPLFIDTSSSNPQNWYIDFYANKKYGNTSYFDIYTDTSTYWLTYNDANPKRFSYQSPIIASPTYFVQSHTCTKHFEKDTIYYGGYNDNQLRTIEDVKGEGWYWAEFFPNQVKYFYFNLDTILNPTGILGTFKIRLQGTTAIDPPDTAISRHLARIALNGTLIDSIFFTQNNEVIYVKSIKDSLLRKGNNTLEIRSVNIPSRVNKFTLDWFEITFPFPLSVENNYLEFTTPANSNSDPTEFTISKVSSDSIDIYDLTTNRIITEYYKIGKLWKFKDTLSNSKRYVVTAKNQRLTPISIIPHIFTDIRNNSTGADYLVITHSLFKNSAQTLANARASRYGIRTAVIDVLDIYNEFNYGHINPESIKKFLLYTYQNWQHPAPSYVLMFGDAATDFRKKISTTIKTNYVPGYGNPMSDNAMVCFDSIYSFIPSMIIGRIPTENQQQAQNVVDKILNYDNPPKDFWNKRMLFITGGTNSSEQWQFNSLSDLLINENVVSYPLGGEAIKVYKSSSAIIDGDYKYYMQGLVNEGLSFINFIGHSGGRIWNVDIGNPNDLQNTNGKLPFISSVSCNIGAFYMNYANVLSEEFLFANNRGAIGTWASSHVSSANTGYWFTKKFLSAATKESIKTFGELTHISKFYFWMLNGYVVTPTIIFAFNLYPLIGDPYSTFALPEKPDFVINPDMISYTPKIPISDNFIYLKIILRNFGLIPEDSVWISIKDNYVDELGIRKGESDLVPPFKWRPFAYVDTINILWDVRGKSGLHTVTVNIDPSNLIDEIYENNNTTQFNLYINKNTIDVLKPLPFSIVQSGQQTLRVTVPMSFDTTKTSFTFEKDSLLYYKNQQNTNTQYSFYFELDTTFSFDSPFKITSPPIPPSLVFTEWVTPHLSNQQVYYWRCRTYDGKHYGAWVNSSFKTDDTAYSPNLIKWNQNKPNQFLLNENNKTIITDSGLTMITTNGLNIYVRSVGARANMDADYYSIIKIGNIVITGLWWQNAYSYIAARIDPLTGNFIAKGYTLSNIGEPDSMLNFIQSTPSGYYIVLSTVLNGAAGMNQNLYQAIENLGAVYIRNVQSGHAWALISRKGTLGPMMPPLESYSPTAIADTDYLMPSYYSAGTGESVTPQIGPANSWLNLVWDNINPDKTYISLYIIGIKKDFTIDTLIIIPSNQKFVDLSAINAYQYPRIKLLSRLSNTDGELTPVLKYLKVNYLPPAEVGISPAVFRAPSIINNTDELNVSLDVFNLSEINVDSVKVTFSVFQNQFIETLWLDSISANNYKTINANLNFENLIGDQILITKIELSSKYNELTEENNVLRFPFVINLGVKVLEDFDITFDGKKIRNGDYVSARPTIKIKLPENYPHDNLAKIEIGNINYLKDGVLNKNYNHNTIEINPVLKSGKYNLTITDKFGQNIADINFQVSFEPAILDIFCYPNPFVGETYFTFNLVGESSAQYTLIEIFTVSGKKVKELKISNPEIGYHRIHWNGKDQDGNDLANGVYLYRIKTKFEKEFVSGIEKVVRFR